MCLECEGEGILQPDGTCWEAIEDCQVEPEFYTVTINKKLACPLCKEGQTFNLDSLECELCQDLGCKTCDNYGKCLSCDTDLFLWDGICLSIDENCASKSPFEYIVIDTYPECPYCKDEYYKDEDGKCSLECEEKFPECAECSDDGFWCHRCEIGYHLGLFSTCIKTKTHHCPIINENQHWFNASSKQC